MRIPLFGAIMRIKGGPLMPVSHFALIRSFSSIFGVILLAVCLDVPRCQAQSGQVLQRVLVPKEVLSGKDSRWDKGLLLVHGDSNGMSPEPQFWVYRGAKLLYPVSIWFDDTKHLRAYSAAAIDSQGSIVVSALAWSVDGRMANLLCFLNNRGVVTKVVRTNPFLAEHLTVASDGSIWGFGVNSESAHGDVDQEVFYRFSSEGTLLNKSVPRTSLAVGKMLPAYTSRRGRPYILSSDQGVGAYIPEAERWMEFDLKGSLIGSWEVPLPEARPVAERPARLRVDFMALTKSGEVFAWMTGGQNRGLYLLDKARVRWVAAPSANGYSGIFGAEGSDLIMASVKPGGIEFVWLLPAAASDQL